MSPPTLHRVVSPGDFSCVSLPLSVVVPERQWPHLLSPEVGLTRLSHAPRHASLRVETTIKIKVRIKIKDYYADFPSIPHTYTYIDHCRSRPSLMYKSSRNHWAGNV